MSLPSPPEGFKLDTSATPAPPDGFTIDPSPAAAAPAVPPPPAGFQLDAAAPAPPATPLIPIQPQAPIDIAAYDRANAGGEHPGSVRARAEIARLERSGPVSDAVKLQIVNRHMPARPGGGVDPAQIAATPMTGGLFGEAQDVIDQGVISAAKGMADPAIGMVQLVAPEAGSDLRRRAETGLHADPTTANKILRGTGNAITSTAAGLVGGGFAGAAGLGAGGVTGAGMASAGGLGGASAAGGFRGKVAEARAAGAQISAADEAWGALAYAAAEGIPEAASFGFARAAGPITSRLVGKFGQAAVMKFMPDLAKRIALATAANVPENIAEELATQFMQNAVDRAIIDPNQSLTEGVGDAALGGLGGGVVGAGVTLASDRGQATRQRTQPAPPPATIRPARPIPEATVRQVSPQPQPSQAQQPPPPPPGFTPDAPPPGPYQPTPEGIPPMDPATLLGLDPANPIHAQILRSIEAQRRSPAPQSPQRAGNAPQSDPAVQPTPGPSGVPPVPQRAAGEEVSRRQPIPTLPEPVAPRPQYDPRELAGAMGEVRDRFTREAIASLPKPPEQPVAPQPVADDEPSVLDLSLADKRKVARRWGVEGWDAKTRMQLDQELGEIEQRERESKNQPGSLPEMDAPRPFGDAELQSRLRGMQPWYGSMQIDEQDADYIVATAKTVEQAEEMVRRLRVTPGVSEASANGRYVTFDYLDPASRATTSEPESPAPAAPGGTQPAPPKAREPWEMTREEFRRADSQEKVADTERQLTAAAQRIRDNWKPKKPLPVGIDPVQAFLAEMSGKRITRLPPNLRDMLLNYNTHLDALKREPADPHIQDRVHRVFIDRALAAGKPVPANVLADYPDLNVSQPPTQGAPDVQTQRQAPAEVLSEQGGEKPPVPESESVPLFELGRRISGELGQSSLKPLIRDVRRVAESLGIKIGVAQRALAAFNDPDGGGRAGRELVEIKKPEVTAPAPADTLTRPPQQTPASDADAATASVPQESAPGKKPPRVRVVGKRPKPAAPAKPFTKVDIANRVVRAYDEQSGVTEEEFETGKVFGSMLNAFTFLRRPGTKTGFPGEAERFFESPEGISARARGVLRLTDDAAKAGGEDAMSAMGEDRYFRAVAAEVQGRTGKALKWAKSHPDPELRFLAALHENLPARKDRKPFTVADPAGMPAGTTFEINGAEFEVIEGEDGYRVLKDGEDYPVVPAEALSEIPVDKGSVKMPRGESDESDLTGAVPDDPFGEFHQEPAPSLSTGTARFEAGKKLSATEKKEVLKTIGDTYRDAKLKRDELKGYRKDSGDPYYGYPHRPDLFITSDITGAKIRHYIKLPDGRKAHPSELYPNLSRTEVDRALSEREAEEVAAEYGRKTKDARIATDKGEANAKYHRTNRPTEGSYFAQDGQGRIVRVDGKDPEDVAHYESAGFKPITAPVAQDPLSTGTAAAGGKVGLFGQPDFDAPAGGQEMFGFKQDDDAARRSRSKTFSTEIERKQIDVPRETIGSAEANRPENTGEMFPEKGAGGAALAEPSVAGAPFMQTASPQTATVPAAKTTTLQPVNVPELVRLSSDILGGKVPQVRKRMQALGYFKGTPGSPESGRIQIRADQAIDPKQLAGVLAHEIGHAIDFMPEGTLKRGNILGRIATLHGFLKHTLTTSVPPAKRDEITKELKAVSGWWRGPIPKSGSAAKYRNSSKELYADAISVLLNSPGDLQQRAPRFFDAFFQHIDAKPEVRDAYLGLMDTLNGHSDELAAQRRDDVREMFAKGEDIWKARHKEAEEGKQNWLSYVRQLLFDKAIPVLSIERKSKPGAVPWDQSLAAKHALEELNMVGNPLHLWARQVHEQVTQPLAAAGLDRTTAGEYLFHTRVAYGDRGGAAEKAQQTIMQITGKPTIAEALTEFEQNVGDDEQAQELLDLAKSGKINPKGYTPETSREYLAAMKKDLGPQKFAAVEQAAQRLRDMAWTVVEDAVKAGTYNRDLVEKVLKDNKDFYAPFAVLKYLDRKVKAGIYRQIGTFEDIANPFDAMLLKTMSLIRLNEIQKARRTVIGLLQQHAPDTIGEPKPVDKYHRLKPPRAGHENLIHFEDGKPVAYEVESYVAKVFAFHDIGALARMGRTLGNATYRVFHPLWIGWNAGWQVMNLPRDFQRTFVNSVVLRDRGKPMRQVLDALLDLGRIPAAYARAVKPAARRAMGRNDPQIRRMLEDRSLDTPFVRSRPDDDTEQYDRFLMETGVWEKPESRSKIIRSLVKLFDGMEMVGTFLETMPKVAMYDLATRAGVQGRERAYIVRNYAGTPNTKRKGLSADLHNAVFTYSNVILQGYRADAEIATNPKTAGGRMVRSAMLNYGPKTIMLAAAAGLMGEWLKRFFEDVPEYDKAKYVIIPLGREGEDGKPVYLRLPHNDTDRVFAAAFWKLFSKEPPKSASEVAGLFAGEFPGLNPYITMAQKWSQWAGGQNPRDDFRGRDILTRDQQLVGGWARLKPMLLWTTDQTGIAGQTIRAAATWKQTQTGEPTTTAEKLVQSVPGVSSMMKISDRGAQEQRWEDVEAEDRVAAELRLKMPANVRKASQDRYRLNRLGAERLTPRERSQRAKLNQWYSVYEAHRKAIANAPSEQAADRIRARLEQITEKILVPSRASEGSPSPARP
jgi:hypothetical protein